MKTPKADKKYLNRIIVVDKDWEIRRIDRFNWIIVHEGQWFEKGYHGTLCSAFAALPAAMLSVEAKNDVGEILEATRRLQKTIRNAIPF